MWRSSATSTVAFTKPDLPGQALQAGLLVLQHGIIGQDLFESGKTGYFRDYGLQYLEIRE